METIFKAGSRYFSTLEKAETYRKKYFSSARHIEKIQLDCPTVTMKESDKIVIRACWYLPVTSPTVKLRSVWLVCPLNEFDKRNISVNVMELSRGIIGNAQMEINLVFDNMRQAYRRLRSKKFTDLVQSEFEDFIKKNLKEAYIKI